MVKYLIYNTFEDATLLIDKIDNCLGFPNNMGTISYTTVDDMINYGNQYEGLFGVEIADYVMNCLNQEELNNIIEIYIN